MNKEKNCHCVVCTVEAALLDSLSTQTARNHFIALANNYPVFRHFHCPLDALATLHEQAGAADHDPGNQILHAVVNAVWDKGFEGLGQQLLLVAFTPAIHKIYREVCQRFPSLPPDDVAQQVWVAFLETANSPALLRQNGQLAVALVMNCRKAMLRWSMKEGRGAFIVQNSFPEYLEPMAEDNLEELILLEDFLRQARRTGILSAAEYRLLLKFKCEGFRWRELSEGAEGPSAIALYRRVQRTIHRLRRAQSRETALKSNSSPSGLAFSHSESRKNILQQAVDFSGDVPFSNSEKELSPELSRPMPQVGTDVAHVAV